MLPNFEPIPKKQHNKIKSIHRGESSCGKSTYKFRSKAKAAIRQIERQPGYSPRYSDKKLHVYYCVKCCGFHVGHA
jgi:hypothetical protein